MKRIPQFILAVFILIGVGCSIVIDKSIHYDATPTNKESLTVEPASQPYRTGAVLGDVPKIKHLRDHPAGAAMLATTLPASGGVLSINRMPVLYQQGLGCGPCQLAAVAFPVAHQTFGPAAAYVWSRQHSYPATWQNDSGTTTISNLWVAQNQGQPRLSVWGYWQENINVIPSTSAIADAENYKLTPLATPDINSVESALAGGGAVGLYIYATNDLYNPVALPDGSFEVRTPTTSSTRIGGHFWTAVWYDNNRKMLDGTTGGMLIENSWGTNWAQQGFAWVSTAGWVTSTKNGNLSQAYTLLPSAPPITNPLNITITSPATPTLTVSAGTVVTFVWTSNADKVTSKENLYNSLTTYPANGTFINRAVGKPRDSQIFTFTATRGSDTIVKTVTVTIAP